MSYTWSKPVWNSPSRKTFFYSYILTLILLEYIDISWGQSSTLPKVVLRRCPEFEDNRNVTSDDILLTIPGNLTNSDETVDFAIDKNEHRFKCKTTFLKNVTWEDGKNLAYNKSNIRGWRLKLSGKTSSHFTHDGYFHDEGNYYKPEEYCVQSISENELQIQLCSISCSDPDRICVPKCCGVDETLIFWNFTCKKISPDGIKWEPLLYNGKRPYNEITDKKQLEKVHIQRHHPGCDFFDFWPLTNTIRPMAPKPGKPPKMDQFGIHWRLLPNKRPIFFDGYRRFVHIPEGDYCVDGFANWGRGGNGTYSGDRKKHSVLLICPKVTNKSEAKEERVFNEGRAWTYSLILIFSAVFPLLTAVIHLLLIDTQHLHGLTVLCHAVSMFFFYIFLAMAHFTSIFPGIKSEPRTGFCLAVAILAHYFCMTNFTWLSVMNFDLWLTFRSMRPVSRMSKQIRRFRIYFCIGWGLPAILSGIFYSLDLIYKDQYVEITIPDYAVKNCFVAAHARGYYLYLLIAIALSFNTILVLWTFYIFYEFRKQNANTFKTKRSKSEKYSVRLFIKLFCVMGVAWKVELLSWYYNDSEKPQFLVILDCIMFLQAFAIFFIFCINRRTLKQLEEKYSCLRCIIGPIRRHRWFQAPSDGEGCVEMTTPGSTPRKLSLSVTTKLDSTLPRNSTRKASSSSIRSMASNKFPPSKMDSIPLDSDNESGVGTMESLNEIVEQAPQPDLLTNT